LLARRNDAKKFEKKKQAKPEIRPEILVVSKEPSNQPDKLFLAPVLQSVVQNKKS